MRSGQLNYRLFAAIVVLLLISLPVLLSGCSGSGKIPPELENQLKSTGVKDINLDFSFQSPDMPDKKYLALTVTYNFSTADGTPQKEYRGYILKRDNGSWKVEHSTGYTKNSSRAKDLMEGRK